MTSNRSVTLRLHYDDSYLRTFTARVIARSIRGERPAVALDRSAFYPEGGGQPGDRGMLNDVRVLDTQREDPLVWHILAGELPADEVTGAIDWTRRFDFMQQHHGQHLLSAAFARLFDTTTVSAHLGEEFCTVDLATNALSPDHLTEAEELANQTIWDDLQIKARFVDADELQRIPLRKQPVGFERVRIVSAGDFDHTPCGGTHPRRTGEVGSILLRRWERRGDTLRIEFVCGARAIRDYRWRNALLNNLAADLSVGPLDLPGSLARLRETGDRQRKALAIAEDQLIGYEAAELLAAAERINGAPLVTRAFYDREIESLRRLALAIAAGGGIALLGLHGAKAQLIFARASGLPYDMGALLRESVTIIGGRGGGRPELAQGGGPDTARLDEALDHARNRLHAEHSDQG